MKIIPAIDLIDGQSVRLSQGDYDEKIIMPKTPQEAVMYYSQFPQVSRIHVVDLIGAAEQESVEAPLIGQIKKLTNIPLELGGGLRSLETIELYDDLGIDYFILGSRAILDVPWLIDVVEKYPGRIFVGIDARGEDIYVNGWKENSQRQIEEYVKEIESLNLAGIIYTDINKDGMEQGPNVNRTAQLNNSTRHLVVASGGVRGQADLKQLEAAGITEAIVGKAAQNDSFWKGLS
ncbi:1-(5-phosphoribosyl)-5-((5-phosphoribosylamino)methylideneamino)imidazole-4-carboxamide isomerase [Ruoffia tabacinasalis]|jgi:phosphoribosylformimino-5-aminoimidazole carboxamide ribotide isomerase|uniref:1-(5-phosphoribosyl)-5-[(5-phosphoribosylamino)methylideneamino] imidazole-4-carboxamide isomerase n=1 Tax=Ruoffia tabacinasalis TaxID=87458 RepID=A0A5R9E0B4_9LACT|nr:HisA/HisF-related TIM barrel protein [Ruoffia tabacinasalis]TLQ41778.1 1-(5-phosphoribosyl)-5-((5-phosphoribosylamino)methylideneamino)imidazole-4-carboxamide isomerase [Ruoffia tabacinasalis]